MVKVYRITENRGLPKYCRVPIGAFGVEVPQQEWDSTLWGHYEELVRAVDKDDLPGFKAIQWIGDIGALNGFYADYRFEVIELGRGVRS